MNTEVSSTSGVVPVVPFSYVTRGSREPVPEPLPPWDPFPDVPHKQARVDDSYYQLAISKLPVPTQLRPLSSSSAAAVSAGGSTSTSSDPSSLAAKKLVVEKGNAAQETKRKYGRLGPASRLKESLQKVTVPALFSTQAQEIWDSKTSSQLISQSAREFIS
jgi:hypothetical protein